MDLPRRFRNTPPPRSGVVLAPAGGKVMDRHVAGAEAKVIRMDGILDVPAVRRLALELADAGEGAVLVDLTHVREFHDFGVALLARELAGREGISIAGLDRHHVRLLRYLGIEAGAEDLADPADLA